MKAMVLGAGGQDGTLLTYHLYKRGYDVTGIGRRQPLNAEKRCHRYLSVDLRDASALKNILQQHSPDVIFHLAVVHGSAGIHYETLFPDMLDTTFAPLHEILEYLRLSRPDARLIYTSSSKVFAEPADRIFTEHTPRRPSCLYGIVKNTAGQLIDYYRSNFKVISSNVLMFNHESTLRPDSFFIPKLISILSSSIDDPNYVGDIHTLDFQGNWGSAAEYMELAILIAEGGHAEDFVLGAPSSTYARDLAERLFARHDLDYRRHIREIQPGYSNRDLGFSVDTCKLRRLIGRSPEISIDEVCLEILLDKNKRIKDIIKLPIDKNS